MAAGDVYKALSSFRKAVEIRPDYAHGHYNLTILLIQLGELSAAETNSEKSVAGLRSTQTLTGLPNCLLRQERAEEAISYRPGFADAHHNLAAALEFLGQADAARQHFRKAAALDRRSS